MKRGDGNNPTHLSIDNIFEILWSAVRIPFL